MAVREILRQKGSFVLTVPAHTPVAAAADLLARRTVGALPVVEGGRLVGMFSERVLVEAVAARGAAALALPVRAVMAEAPTCTPDDSLHTLMARMTTRRLRHLPVVQAGQLVGIVSVGDVIKHRLREVTTEAAVLREYTVMMRAAA
ncbi:MAG TPA: CBS domain-containing protein [Rubricoccaceae bacterium]|nr:CBS domain-containing protein [Rubricoccaceae bacterium]